jgi:GTPase
MEPEKEDGKIEYKLKLLNTDEKRINELASQMAYRCNEGFGECIYNIGVRDNGITEGITEEEFNQTIKNLNIIASKNNYYTQLLSSQEVDSDKTKKIYEVLVREINNNSYIDIKVVIAGNVDAGKCVLPLTPIIMYDGTIKLAKDIKINDVLMGDDSTHRKVLELHSGSTNMYEIQQTRGDNYTVTENHILTLKFGLPTIRKYKKTYIVISHIGNGVLRRNHFKTYEESETHLSTIKDNIETVDISVKDYITKGKNWKDMFLGYSVPVEFEEKNIDLDPYFLGAWLGDGTSSNNSITNIDQEILEKLQEICVKNKWIMKKIKNTITYSFSGLGKEITRSTNKLGINGLTIHKNKYIFKWHTKNNLKKQKTFKTKNDAITFINNCNDRKVVLNNAVTDYLRKYNLINNKHIPYQYLYNTRNIRLQVLAGLIDTDGYMDNNCYFITQKNERLAKDICYLARSLGFKTIYKQRVKRCKNSKSNPMHEDVYYENTISGEGLHEVPVVLQRKKISKWNSNIRPLMTTIKVVSVGIKEYNGFTLDDNGRFLLGDFTVTHNSSTLGSLTTCKLDDGRGLSRASVFNFVHELKSGRTSSIAHVIMGYDKEGNIINNEKLSWTDITKKSSKIINFYDLAGHEKYFRTTILGITSSHPDFCFIIIAANDGITRMTKEHIFLCVTMGIPFAIIVSKIDICNDRKNVLVDTMASINRMLKFPGIRRLPLNVKNKEDIILAAKNIYNESVVPIFKTSNITGYGLDNIRFFLNIINKRNPKNYNNDPVEYHIDNTFNVYGFGFVLGGQLIKGTIRVGDKLFVGPIHGEYESITVRSIHSKKTPLQEVNSGAYVCIGIKKKIPVRKGNVVVSAIEDKLLVKKFKAKITVLKSHSTTIKTGYEPIMCTSCIRETVKILNIENKINYRQTKELQEEDNVLRSGDVAEVTFEFKYNFHYIKPNTRIILAEGLCKMSGCVIEILS